jgi:hypothetical protein
MPLSGKLGAKMLTDKYSEYLTQVATYWLKTQLKMKNARYLHKDNNI